MLRNVLVTGGAGYVGCRLVPRLLAEGHRVTVYDALYFGNHLKPHHNLRVVQGDVRDAGRFAQAVSLVNHDAVLHLACISNDPSFELDESLSRTINFEAFEPLVLASKAAGVRRFVYCSSSSVYGVSESPDVTEEHPLVPITLYNTYKARCEPILFAHQSPDFVCAVLRPSTVCGYSPRLRLDLAVNILTHLAVAKRRITVFGGAQMRPNLHVEDMVDAYLLMLDAPAGRIAGEVFNVGAANYSISELAEIVRLVVLEEMPALAPIEIETTASVDPRSYQVSSEKIARVLGFRPIRTVEDAVRDLCTAFAAGLVPDSLGDDRYYNVRQMRRVWADVYRGAGASEFDPTRGVLSEIDMLRAKS